jgi:hypothetical protein
MISTAAAARFCLAGSALLSLMMAGGCPVVSDGRALVRSARDQQAAIAAAAPALSGECDRGLQALSAWDALPCLGTRTYTQFSSHNRNPGTADFEPGGKDFNNFIALSGPDQPLLMGHVDGPDPDGGTLGGYVLAAVDDGPGYVARMFFTRFGPTDLFRQQGFFASPDRGRCENEVLRVDVDDLDAPSLVIPLTDLGTAAPFTPPLAGRTAAAVTSYVPISFGQRLRVVLDGLNPLSGYFYHIGVQRIDAPTRAYSPRLAEDPDYAAAVSLWRRFGGNPNAVGEFLVEAEACEIAPRSSATICTDDTGGTLTLLRFMASARQPELLHAQRLQVFYDRAATPAIDVPLDAFFGCEAALASFRTLALRVEVTEERFDAACFLPMPYASRVRIALLNGGAHPFAVRASVAVNRALPAEPWGYLHAHHHAVEGAQAAGSQHEVANLVGRGRYIGTCLAAVGLSDPRPGQPRAALNILEGNELGIIDGEVRLRGTGTEDYYNGGFYFATGPYSRPLSAANHVRGEFAVEPGDVSCSRWHLLGDALDFQPSFMLSFQYAADNPALVVRYATVAYYYLDRPSPR